MRQKSQDLKCRTFHFTTNMPGKSKQSKATQEKKRKEKRSKAPAPLGVDLPGVCMYRTALSSF